MVLVAVAMAVGVPILWAMSIGAVREIRRLRAQEPSWTGCPAWVEVRLVPGRRYRCGVAPAPGAQHCPHHAAAIRRGSVDEPGGRDQEEPAGVGRAIAQLRIALLVLFTLAVLTIVVLVALR